MPAFAGGGPHAPAQIPAASEFQLSDRELDVLRGLVDGLTYKMIGARHNISYSTVNSHVARIYEKLHVHSVASAVSLALREGLV